MATVLVRLVYFSMEDTPFMHNALMVHMHEWCIPVGRGLLYNQQLGPFHHSLA